MLREQVGAEEWLYRRYYTPERKYMNPDGTATSRVFKLREKDQGELSVDIKSMTTAEKSIHDPQNFLLFEIQNKEVLDLKLTTEHDPLENGTNNAHAVILGMNIEDEIMPGLLARKSKRVYL